MTKKQNSLVALQLLCSLQSKLDANLARIDIIKNSPILCFSDVHQQEAFVLSEFNTTLKYTIDKLSSII